MRPAVGSCEATQTAHANHVKQHTWSRRLHPQVFAGEHEEEVSGRLAGGLLSKGATLQGDSEVAMIDRMSVET